LVEHRSPKPGVAGSSPVSPAMKMPSPFGGGFFITGVWKVVSTFNIFFRAACYSNGMLKIAKKNILPLVLGFVLLFALLVGTAKVSYYLGERHISELVLHSDVPDGDEATYTSPPPDYDKTVRNLRAERDRLSNDYDAACYNYQALYDAYDKLYAVAGASAGHEEIVRPDSARGNQESCYR
jgi:hypothetical protein